MASELAQLEGFLASKDGAQRQLAARHLGDEYERLAGSYVVNAAALRAAKPDMLVMHPLPRVDEIDTDVDADPRATYFEQMENGMYVRMALLALVLGADLSGL